MSFSASIEAIIAENSNGLLSTHASWVRVPVGLVFDIQNGFPFESNRFNTTGEGVPLLRIRDVVRGETETFYDGPYDPAFMVQAGDIVVGMDGDFRVRRWRGRAALLNQRVCRLIPRGNYPAELLSFVLQGYLDAINAKTSSITVKHLSSKTIEEIPLPLPPPMEQGRVVDAIGSYLSRLDAAVATLEAAQAKLKAYRASVLKAAVEGRLAPTEAALARAEKRDFEPADVLLKRILSERRRRWEEAELAKLKAAGKSPKDDKWKTKYEEPSLPETKDLLELPEGWCWASIEMLADVGTGATPNRGTGRYWTNGTVPWVTSAVASLDYVTEPSEFVTEAALAETNLTLYPAGTLLVAMYGEGKTRGHCTELRIQATTNQALAALATDGLCTSLRPWLRTFMAFNYENLRRLASGGVQQNLNLSIVKGIRLPLPPLVEQQRIVNDVEGALSTAASVDSEVEKQIRRSVRLRQAVLKWAVEGKLVDQDPNDEPAEKLLERIRAERANTETPKRTRGARKAP